MAKSGKVVVQMGAESGEYLREMAKMRRQMESMDNRMRKLSASGQEAGRGFREGFDTKSMRAFNLELAAVAAQTAGISFAIGAVSKDYTKWIDHMRDLTKEARKASNEIVAFAALQSGGTARERVLQVSKLAQIHGIKDRGEAFNVVQALQSAASSSAPGVTEQDAFNSALKSAAPVFMASRLGVPLDAALEAERQGVTQKMAEGQMLRNLYVAGQLSSRDPANLIAGAPALMRFKDKEFGAAVMSQIAGPFGPQITPYTRGAAIALSSVGSASDWYEKQGLTDATNQEKLRALYEGGFTTADKLAEIGIKEIRQAEGLLVAIQNFPAIEKLTSDIRRISVEGILGAQLYGVSSQLPTIGKSAKLDFVEATIADLKARGPDTVAAMDFETRNKILGAAILKEGGFKSFLGFDVIDEEGSATTVGRMLYGRKLKTAKTSGPQRLTSGTMGGRAEYEEMTLEEIQDQEIGTARYRRIRATVQELTDAWIEHVNTLKKASDAISNASSNMQVQNQKALSHPTVDM